MIGPSTATVDYNKVRFPISSMTLDDGKNDNIFEHVKRLMGVFYDSTISRLMAMATINKIRRWSVVLCMDSYLHLGKEGDHITGCMVSYVRCLLPILDENTHDGSCDQAITPLACGSHAGVDSQIASKGGHAATPRRLHVFLATSRTLEPRKKITFTSKGDDLVSMKQCVDYHDSKLKIQTAPKVIEDITKLIEKLGRYTGLVPRFMKFKRLSSTKWTGAMMVIRTLQRSSCLLHRPHSSLVGKSFLKSRLFPLYLQGFLMY
ncbi:hypothetical protein VNO77_02019 [Canavalia gladiata]|uniref:Uncharacterized protein n=1 Tax=Canavalia gladiata TaxID=3824 RepID=A0AAN9R5I7_CANGL